MGYLPAKPFSPTPSPVPNLGPSSGNPAALKDPKSIASIGGNIQAMHDQVQADQLYDVRQKDGFLDYTSAIGPSNRTTAIVFVATGLLCILYSMR